MNSSFAQKDQQNCSVSRQLGSPLKTDAWKSRKTKNNDKAEENAKNQSWLKNQRITYLTIDIKTSAEIYRYNHDQSLNHFQEQKPRRKSILSEATICQTSWT